MGQGIDPLFSRLFPEDRWDGIQFYHDTLASHLGSSSRVLDLGCGDNRDLVRHQTPNRELWGTDFSQHSEIQRPEWFRPLDPDGTVPFPDAMFDVIGAKMVLEHVRQPEAFLAEVARLLKPGGHFVALTVNALHYVTFIARLVSLLPHGVTQGLVHRLYRRQIEDTFPTVYAMNTVATLKRQARAAGLEVASIVRSANPDYFSFNHRLRRLAIRFDWLLEQFAPVGRLYLVVTLRKPAVAIPQPMGELVWRRAS